MSDFIVWFGQTIAQWWSFLCNATVPGCSFSFGTLYLFIIGFSICIAIINMATHNKIKNKE